MSIDESYNRLTELIRGCQSCSLRVQGAGVMGVYVGDGPWETMVVGEAPGALEQVEGKPFVGESGQLLRTLLTENGLPSFYLTNLVKHRPWVVNRKQQPPDAEALHACRPFLKAELTLVQPKRLILLGKTAAVKVLALPGNPSMGGLVGRQFVVDDIPTLVLYHPAWFLHNRTAPWVQKAIKDWARALRTFLGDKPPVYKIARVSCPNHSPSI